MMIVGGNATATDNVGEVTKLPVPRFVSLAGDKIYARSGPGTRFPISWEYHKRGLPVEIIKEFDNWRKIRDKDGEEGWVHRSLLSSKRFVIQNEGQAIPMFKNAQDDSHSVALVESGVVLRVDSCKNDWCRVLVSGFKGWIPTVSLWGIYEGERIE